MKLKMNVFLLIVAAMALLPNCKSDSKGKNRNNNNPADNPANQRYVNPQGARIGGMIIYLNNQQSGSTIQANSQTIDLPVRVDGSTIQNLVVGLLVDQSSSNPSNLTLVGSAGNYSLRGTLPYGSNGQVSVSILARDRALCAQQQGQDCQVMPDQQGRFTNSLLQQNQAYDTSAQFYIQANDYSNVIGGGGSGGQSGGIFQRFMGYMRNLFNRD